MLYRRRNLIFYTPDMQDNKWPIKTLLLERNSTLTEALIPLQGAYRLLDLCSVHSIKTLQK